MNSIPPAKPLIPPEENSPLRRQFEQALDQLHLVFQPLVQAQGRVVTGHEVLVRSEHDRLHSAPRLLAVAQTLGRRSCLDDRVRLLLAAWADRQSLVGRLHVNLCGGELTRGLIGSHDDPLLRFAPQVVLEFEQSEEVIATAEDINAPAYAQTQLQLRRAGYRVLVGGIRSTADDLMRLRRLRPDMYKISLLAETGRDGDRSDRLLDGELADLAQLARAEVAQLYVIGVEQRREADRCRELGANILQGLALGPPAALPSR